MSASKCIAKLARSWLPCAFQSSHDNGLQVHVWVHSIVIFRWTSNSTSTAAAIPDIPCVDGQQYRYIDTYMRIQTEYMGFKKFLMMSSNCSDRSLRGGTSSVTGLEHVLLRAAAAMSIDRYTANEPYSLISPVLRGTWISKKLLAISLLIVVLILAIVSQLISTILLSNIDWIISLEVWNTYLWH